MLANILQHGRILLIARGSSWNCRINTSFRAFEKLNLWIYTWMSRKASLKFRGFSLFIIDVKHMQTSKGPRGCLIVYRVRVCESLRKAMDTLTLIAYEEPTWASIDRLIPIDFYSFLQLYSLMSMFVARGFSYLRFSISVPDVFVAIFNCMQTRAFTEIFYYTFFFIAKENEKNCFLNLYFFP